MASGIYNQFKAELMSGTFDLVNDTVKVALMNSSHSFSASAIGWSSVSANEISGTGYTAGGAALANKSVTQNNTNNDGVFDADDLSWTSATFTAYHAVLHDTTPTSPADPLICSIDFGGAQTVSSGTFTIQWDSDGIINIT